MEILTRREVLIGATGIVGAGLLAGCGDGQPDDGGPVINKTDPGNVVSEADVRKFCAKLDRLYAAGDINGLVKSLNVETADAKKVLQNSMKAARLLPFAVARFYLATSSDRTVNSSGSQVEYDTNLVFAHQIKDCDAKPISRAFPITVLKKTRHADLIVTTFGLGVDDLSPMPWDVTEISVQTSKHAVVVTAKKNARAVKAVLDKFEAGTKTAIDTVPPAKGVSKVFFVMSWGKKADESLFDGWGRTLDRDAFAASAAYVDPQQIADGTIAADAQSKSGSMASGRVFMRTGSLNRMSEFQQIACHEAVHVLADQWGRSRAPTWVVEGLATWVAEGRLRGLRGDRRAAIRSGFAGFRHDILSGDYNFQKQSDAEVNRNYLCSAAIFAYLEDTKGKKKALELAELCYRNGAKDGVRQSVGKSIKELFEDVGAWVRNTL